MKLKTTAHTSQTTLMPPHIHIPIKPHALFSTFSPSLSPFCWHLNGMKFWNNSKLSHRIWHVGAQYGLIWATTREHIFRIRSPYNGGCLALGYFYFSNGCHSLESFVTWILRPVTSTMRSHSPTSSPTSVSLSLSLSQCLCFSVLVEELDLVQCVIYCEREATMVLCRHFRAL